MVKPSYYDRLPHMKPQGGLSTKDNRVAGGSSLPKKTGVRRCGRNCSKSKGNNQRADVAAVADVHNNFSPAEEELVIKLHATIGSRWSIIAQQIPDRSDDDVKNLWNSKLKKKLSAMGIDPITHRPFSQILADYGNIGSNMHKNLATRFGYLNKLQEDGTLINPFIPQESSSEYDDVKLSNYNFSSASASATTTAPSNYEDDDHSVELLSQLQAIQMVTQASNYSNTSNILEDYSNNNNSATMCNRLMPNECISSSVSSSSPESPQAAAAAVITNKEASLGLASPNFSWRDFLSEDTFLPAQEEGHDSSSINNIAEEEQKQHLELKEEPNPMNNCCFEQGSFVQDMIERHENQIFSETHAILEEEPFSYY